MTAHKWRLVRVAAGDYLLPNDDLTRVFRIHSFEDGAALGLQVAYRLRTFWRVAHRPYTRLTRDPEELGDAWAPPWVEVDLWLPTRRAAIALAEKTGAVTSNA